jgi:Glyoxal oxidase N-terminus/WSC domain
VAPALPTSWNYRGCWIDNKYGRILEQQPGNDPITIESCVAQCIGIGMDVAGMQYSAQCFCGNGIVNGGALSASDSDCAMTCSGNSTQICGGPNLMSVYASGNLTTYKVPTARATDLPGSWTYEGCLTDIPARVLPYQTDMKTNITITSCLDLCATYGYDAGGLEYGIQCFCGDDTDRVNSGALYRAEADCNQACADSPEDLCGGGNAINYYTRPVSNTWNQGIGDSAGQYQFLIGGVVIPLLTTVGVNNKVTFVEKHGTGPPNSTGAYELDLSEINNFDKAWRTMTGLKTDVFCSAGLTLPDKAGRQINIGGWSAESLYGVRFYTPDGSPGVASVNDWEENVNEVALQIGRWYPTAMTMVNGSILVVGGEDGSNGPPVPNLEVLPKPAGGYLLHCPWLLRTDPYNLYPYLAILPSGGIFVAYYNEALILDEVTLTPKKTLPQIPGAVNNAAAGRTYPLEGTSMLMPQVYPYSDPLKVLICGGSTPFGGHALDNCVSITPEIAGAQWEIERMVRNPSLPPSTHAQLTLFPPQSPLDASCHVWRPFPTAPTSSSTARCKARLGSGLPTSPTATPCCMTRKP